MLWRFFQRRADSATLLLGLLLVTVLLACTATTLAGVVVYRTLYGEPVYFVPPGGPGVVRPGIVADTSAIDHAHRCLKQRYTFTTDTYVREQAEFLQCLHPDMVETFKAKTKREAQEVREFALGSQIAIEPVKTVTRQEGGEVLVHLRGLRIQTVKGVQNKEEPFLAEVTLAPWLPRDGSGGLVVTRLVMDPPFRAIR